MLVHFCGCPSAVEAPSSEHVETVILVEVVDELVLPGLEIDVSDAIAREALWLADLYFAHVAEGESDVDVQEQVPLNTRRG